MFQTAGRCGVAADTIMVFACRQERASAHQRSMFSSPLAENWQRALMRLLMSGRVVRLQVRAQVRGLQELRGGRGGRDIVRRMLSMSGVLGSTTMRNLVPACQTACQTEVLHKCAHRALE